MIQKTYQSFHPKRCGSNTPHDSCERLCMYHISCGNCIIFDSYNENLTGSMAYKTIAITQVISNGRYTFLSLRYHVDKYPPPFDFLTLRPYPEKYMNKANATLAVVRYTSLVGIVACPMSIILLAKCPIRIKTQAMPFNAVDIGKTIPANRPSIALSRFLSPVKKKTAIKANKTRYSTSLNDILWILKIFCAYLLFQLVYPG